MHTAAKHTVTEKYKTNQSIISFSTSLSDEMSTVFSWGVERVAWADFSSFEDLDFPDFEEVLSFSFFPPFAPPPPPCFRWYWALFFFLCSSGRISVCPPTFPPSTQKQTLQKDRSVFTWHCERSLSRSSFLTSANFAFLESCLCLVVKNEMILDEKKLHSSSFTRN